VRTLAEIETAQRTAAGTASTSLRAEFMEQLNASTSPPANPATQDARGITPLSLQNALAVLRAAVRTSPAEATALIQDPTLPEEVRKPARDVLIDEALENGGLAEAARHIRTITENDLMYQAIFRLAERLSENHAPEAVARLLVEHRLLNENLADQVTDAVFSQRKRSR
jgi:hypothetical protein